MTRIFDALKKAEATREATAAAEATVTHAGAAASPRHAGPRAVVDPRRAALPLVGAAELGDETLREMAALRVSLEASLRDRSPRVVMFLSPQGGEGTSTITLQFAQALARDAGVRPLVVDAHVRRPAYEIDANLRCATLSTALRDRAGEPVSVVTSNLFVVPSSEDLRQAGLFQPGQLRQVLESSTEGFDWVLVDGPPVLESPDASALGALADGVVLVVQAGRTKRPVLTRTADLLHKAGARVLGSVLNRRVLEIPEFIYRRI
jgi:Mrp family chromosome partitioning ATPase